MSKKKPLNKLPSPVQLGMAVMPSWIKPPKLIPVDNKYIKLIELGINTKSTWDFGVVINRGPRL
jgi:hypothetical protein